MAEKKSFPTIKGVDHTEIKQVSVNDLIPYARNSRTHSSEQVNQIASSINEWGFTTPVLIDTDNQIITGHGRTMAAKKLGMETVPCLVADGWTEAQKKAYVIADNKLALNAGWDDELLALEISDLQEADFNIDLTGFALDELVGFDEDEEDFEPDLNSDDREPIRNMTFTVSDEQHEIIESILKLAKEYEPKDPMGINENSNGNALWYVCEVFKTSLGGKE